MTTSILQHEIHEQPIALERFLADQATTADELVHALRLRDIQYVLIAARGTSDNAARYAQYVLGAFNRIQVALATPSLYTLYGTPPDLSGALVVGISQSGQSPGIVSVLTTGRAQGRPTLAITNVPDSPLASEAPSLRDNIVAGPAGRFVDEQDAFGAFAAHGGGGASPRSRLVLWMSEASRAPRSIEGSKRKTSCGMLRRARRRTSSVWRKWAACWRPLRTSSRSESPPRWETKTVA